jgi:aromatic ring-opening dioxygenase LigB subunit
MAQVVMNDVISTVRASMASIDSAHTAEVMEKIAAAQDRLDKEIVILQKQHNMSLRELFAIYEQFISNARKDRYWAAANTEAER